MSTTTAARLTTRETRTRPTKPRIFEVRRGDRGNNSVGEIRQRGVKASLSPARQQAEELFRRIS